MKAIRLFLHTSAIIIVLSLYSCSSNNFFDNLDEIGSMIHSQEIIFPTLTEITNDPDIKSAMWDAWNKMQKTPTPYGRQEIGFYIYYDYITKKLWTGDIVYGPKTPWEKAASIDLGVPVNNLQVCACFHCHTPLSYQTYAPDFTGPIYDENRDRVCGPSDTDLELANRFGIPGIVLDFDEPKEQIHSFFLFSELPPVPCPYGPERRSEIYI